MRLPVGSFFVIMTHPESNPASQEVVGIAPLTFIESVERKWNEGKYVCVGLDTRYEDISPEIRSKLLVDYVDLAGSYPEAEKEAIIFMFNKTIIDGTHDVVAVYKPNLAFYEAEGNEGKNALRRTIDYIHENTDVPVILDSKRGDIGNTSEDYARADFDDMRADAITVHNYLGKEAMQPFLDRRDKGTFVLARTSNSGAGEFQDRLVVRPGLEEFLKTGEEAQIQATHLKQFVTPLYQYVAENVASAWNENRNVGIVMGATSPEELKRTREILPDLPLLIPGVGAQGGTVSEVVPAAKGRFLINSSRGIIFASKGEDFAEAARREALKLQDSITETMSHPEGMTVEQEKLADMLFTTKTQAPMNRKRTYSDGSFDFVKRERPTSPVDFAVTERVDDTLEEEFALKVHEANPNAPLSPIYINLRNLPENVLDQFGIVMAEMDLNGERPDLSTGIPNAGTPLAEAYSKHSGINVEEVFDKEESSNARRIVAKQGVDGEGRRLRLVDDLATGGQTKIEAIKAAEEMGFEITDVTVLVDRQQGAAEDLKNAGHKLRAAITLDQLLNFGLRRGYISPEQFEDVQAYRRSS